jgi:diguanylate cyclase (GGDEF)-like protein/PAS domain S-box-containing protein
MSENFEMETKLALVENTVTGIATFDVDGEIFTPIYLNEGLFRMLGYSRTVGMKYIKRFRDLIIPEDLKNFRQGLIDVLKDDGPVEVEFRTVTPNGNIRWLQVRANLFSRNGSVNRINCVIIDATERKTVEEELKLQAVNQDILSASEGEQIIDYNAKTDVLTLKRSDLFGNHTYSILNDYRLKSEFTSIHSEDRLRYQEILEDIILFPKKDSMEFRSNLMGEEYRWYRAVLTSIAGNDGYVIRIIGRLTDIHEKKMKELDLEVKAEKDGMTSLYNKTATVTLIDSFLASINPSEDHSIHALMVIDLDNFKAVNDYLGHATGDEVIINTAEQLKTIFKGYDIIGRIGGDEFLVFAKNLNALADVDILATKICKTIRHSYFYGDKELIVSSSVGISLFPYHGKSYKELFEKADKALYSAKANGKNSHRIFDAANTITYHLNTRSSQYQPEAAYDISRGFEDYILQIFKENQNVKTAMQSIVELITVDINMQRGYYIPIEKTSQFFEEYKYCVEGYENPYESNFEIQSKAIAMKALANIGHQLILLNRASITEETILSFLMKRGIQALLFYPIIRLGKVIGGFCFENHMDKDYYLTDKKQDELNSIFRFMNSYILQAELPGLSMEKCSKIDLFENFDNFVYIIDADTYQIIYLNKRVMQKTKEVNVGDFCYKVLKMNDSPCEDCPLKKMNHQDSKCHLNQEVFHYPMRAWMKYNVSWYHLQKEHSTVIVNCFDVSEYFVSSIKDPKNP